MTLKVIRPRELVMAGKHNEPVYLKSDADEVIAELENKLQNVSEILKETREWLIESQKLHKRCADNAVKTIRHYKYHRCLDTAEQCEVAALFYSAISKVLNMDITDPSRQKFFSRLKHYKKWHKRWLELAEKYKLNNSTAR